MECARQKLRNQRFEAMKSSRTMSIEAGYSSQGLTKTSDHTRPVLLQMQMLLRFVLGAWGFSRYFPVFRQAYWEQLSLTGLALQESNQERSTSRVVLRLCTNKSCPSSNTSDFGFRAMCQWKLGMQTERYRSEYYSTQFGIKKFETGNFDYLL